MEAWFARMSEAGVEVTLVTSDAVLNACAKTEDAQRAEKWCSTMFERSVLVDALDEACFIRSFLR